LGAERVSNADAFGTSRHFPHASCPDVLFDFVQDVIELATPDVALHLLVPLIIVPTVQPRRQLGALFERKLFDGSLDFRKAHVGDLTIAELLFQVPVIQSERLSVGSSDLLSRLTSAIDEIRGGIAPPLGRRARRGLLSARTDGAVTKRTIRT